MRIWDHSFEMLPSSVHFEFEFRKTDMRNSFWTLIESHHEVTIVYVDSQEKIESVFIHYFKYLVTTKNTNIFMP